MIWDPSQQAIEAANAAFRETRNMRDALRAAVMVDKPIVDMRPNGYTNIKPIVPNYNKHLIKKVGRKKVESTPEMRAKAREILRKMGLI